MSSAASYQTVNLLMAKLFKTYKGLRFLYRNLSVFRRSQMQAASAKRHVDLDLRLAEHNSAAEQPYHLALKSLVEPNLILMARRSTEEPVPRQIRV